MACLFISEGPASGRIFALERHALVLLGRDDSCSFQVLDERVSRRHLQVKFDEKKGIHFAIDYESSNGVEINGKRIEKEVELNDGDAIKIGNSSILYSVKDLPDAQTAREAWFKRGQAHQRTMLPRDDDTEAQTGK